VEKPLVPPRSGRELEQAAHAALRHWARPTDRDAEVAAREFLVLYKELKDDTRLPAAQREELRGKIRGRLAQLSQLLARRDARQTRLAKNQAPAVPTIGKPLGVLAQQAPAGGMGGVGGGMGGGPAQADDDYGPSLVELIQTTIAPTTWDVNGGPGSIYYWRQQRALVVRAGDDVQDEIGGVLDQLNRAGP
jgi:hypothetical protein